MRQTKLAIHVSFWAHVNLRSLKLKLKLTYDRVPTATDTDQRSVDADDDDGVYEDSRTGRRLLDGALFVQPRLQREQSNEQRLGVVPRARVRRLLSAAVAVWNDRRRPQHREVGGLRRLGLRLGCRGSVVEDGVVQLVDRKCTLAGTLGDLSCSRRHVLIACNFVT